LTDHRPNARQQAIAYRNQHQQTAVKLLLRIRNCADAALQDISGDRPADVAAMQLAREAQELLYALATVKAFGRIEGLLRTVPARQGTAA
jgi:hypothetical protein